MESMRYENSVVLGTNRVVYTLQFSSTPRYLFQLINLVWQLGVFASIAVLGVIVTTIQELRRRRATFIIFCSFPFYISCMSDPGIPNLTVIPFLSCHSLSYSVVISC